MISGGRSHVSIAYIPQHDHYFETLTCEEALVFASKLKNATIAQSTNFLEFSVLDGEWRIFIKDKNILK